MSTTDFVRKMAAMIERDFGMPNDVALYVAIAATDAMIKAAKEGKDMEEAALYFQYVLQRTALDWLRTKEEIKTAVDLEWSTNRLAVLIAEDLGEPVDFKAPAREMAASARRLGMDDVAEELEAKLRLDDAEYYRQHISAEG